MITLVFISVNTKNERKQTKIEERYDWFQEIEKERKIKGLKI